MPPGKLRNQVNELIRWLMTLISAKVKPCYISQLSENVNNSDPYSIQNHSPALRTFYFLTKLYSDQVVFLIRKTMESNDPIKIVPALQVFMDVFQDVSQTENLKSEVMHSVVAVIQEDLKPVSRKAECLGWEGHCFLETLRSRKMEKERLLGDEERDKAHFTSQFWPQTTAHGLHLGSSKPEKGLGSRQVVPPYFQSLFCGRHCLMPGGDMEL
ncbi:uncharacterized protein [Equus asinus]|uniref:uncharacterized protein isoform X3 n=1 Tax=Equus asinus TaxID=9793 RepID=UPI0038F6E1B4